MKFRIRDLRAPVLFLVWAALVVIWIATLSQYWREGDSWRPLLAVVALVLLAVLFYAEGIELAVAELRDKEVAQVRDVSLRRILREIQERSEFFFSHRQVFVVVIISFTSLVTSYQWIYVPLFGKVSAYNVPFWFSLIFTTLTVLWFCQVIPKRLAISNSELFLSQSRFVWQLVKVISSLGLPNPTDWFVRVIKKRSRYGEPRLLLPSRASHYNTTAGLYGFALDKLSIEITIGKDGGGTIAQKALFLFLHGAHDELHGNLNTLSTFVKQPEIKVTALYVAPAVERFELIAQDLEKIFGGASPSWEKPFNMNRCDSLASHVTRNIHSSLGDGQRAFWTIKTQKLPESFWGEDPEADRTMPFAALLYEVICEVALGAFSVNGTDDGWPESVSLPCRTLSVSVRTRPGDPIRLAMQRATVSLSPARESLPEETLKATRSLLRKPNDFIVNYPLMGATYTVFWQVFPMS